MADIRKDNRDRDPGNHHRGAFLGGWTDAENGQRYGTVDLKRTHANMGNLFGWIFGNQDEEFKLEIWQMYLDKTLNIEEE